VDMILGRAVLIFRSYPGLRDRRRSNLVGNLKNQSAFGWKAV
jgi:hypothetical protein